MSDDEAEAADRRAQARRRRYHTYDGYDACLQNVDALIALPNSMHAELHDPRGARPASTCFAKSRWP